MMYELDPDEFRPPRDLLNQCVQILIADDKLPTRPVDLKRWCFEHCRSFVYMEEADVSDVSAHWDYIYAFYFGEQDDANWFSLKWL